MSSFVRFNSEDSVTSTETIVRPMWANNTYNLNSFYTSSVLSKDYYLNVYNDYPGLSSSPTIPVQFAIQYGNSKGSGSAYINPSFTSPISDNSSLTISRVIYGQYRTLLLGSEDVNFTFNNESPEGVYFINISRTQYKEHINPGSLTLKLKNGSDELTLTDNSKIISNANYTTAGTLYYTLISGSAGTAYGNNPNASVYGYLFPNTSIIVLNPLSLAKTAVSGGINFNPTVDSPGINSNLPTQLYNLISGSNTSSNNSGSFALQSSEDISSRYFFVRIKNQEFNYTTNPSIIDANGNMLYPSLINNPQTFITTVGLYNDNNELLAVAKLSKALVKDFTKEALLKVKLDN